VVRLISSSIPHCFRIHLGSCGTRIYFGLRSSIPARWCAGESRAARVIPGGPFRLLRAVRSTHLSRRDRGRIDDLRAGRPRPGSPSLAAGRSIPTFTLSSCNLHQTRCDDKDIRSSSHVRCLFDRRFVHKNRMRRSSRALGTKLKQSAYILLDGTGWMLLLKRQLRRLLSCSAPHDSPPPAGAMRFAACGEVGRPQRARPGHRRSPVISAHTTQRPQMCISPHQERRPSKRPRPRSRPHHRKRWDYP
jgi:hypothetical protein